MWSARDAAARVIPLIEHRAGQIVRTAQKKLVEANVAGGRVHRRRIYAFEIMSGFGGVFSGDLPAVDVFSEDDVPVQELPSNQVYEDLLLSLFCDLYVINPEGALGGAEGVDARTMALRRDVERALMSGNQTLGLPYVVAVYRDGASPQLIEREGELPVHIYRVQFRVHYRTPIVDPAEVET